MRQPQEVHTPTFADVQVALGRLDARQLERYQEWTYTTWIAVWTIQAYQGERIPTRQDFQEFVRQNQDREAFSTLALGVAESALADYEASGLSDSLSTNVIAPTSYEEAMHGCAIYVAIHHLTNNAFYLDSVGDSLCETIFQRWQLAVAQGAQITWIEQILNTQ